VPNAHAAMLEQSLPVNIKFDAYNAADYGSVPGLVRWISPNSIEHEEYGFVYEIEVEILVSNSTDPIDSRIILRPGLTATVDVKIGKRNLLEIFLEPLFRWRNEALREA
jgi:membrane fusion protein, hemolysin D